MPASKLKARIAEILKDEGFIGAIASEDGRQAGRAHDRAPLRQQQPQRHPGHPPRLGPGQRRYVRHDRLPRVRSGLGIAILTTSKGVMTDREARKQGVGGELLCEVW